MRKSSAADFAGEETLDAAELVLEVLRLLTQGPAGPSGASGFDGVANTFRMHVNAFGDDWKIWWKQAVVVNEDNVGEAFADTGTDKLSNEFATDWTPGTVDAIYIADVFSVVEWGGRVAVCNDLAFCNISIFDAPTVGV